MTIPRLLAASTLLLSTLFTQAAVDTRQGCLDPRFRTLTVDVEGIEMAPPIINLGAGDRIVITFDELTDDHSYLRYSLLHCNANWQPSQLVESEYVSGFNQADITDYEYSRGTSAHYVHYSLAIPNEDMEPLVSGNYLLRVWEDTNPDVILVQARFMVAEGGVAINGNISSRTDIDYNRSHQQLELNVSADRAQVSDPFNDLIVKVQQNSRLDNEVTLAHPSRVSGSVAYYEHLNPLIFPAGNEYRRFENSSVSFPGMGVYAIDYYDPYYNFTLNSDQPRSSEPYSYDQTQNGRFRIREYNSANSATEADYTVVHFTLDSPRLDGQRIYIDGDLTNRNLDQESEMHYNPVTMQYEKSMLLKQGAYNYQYLVYPPRPGQTATSPIEGDLYPTVNEYLITVYNRPPGARYDRLIGATRLLFNH